MDRGGTMVEIRTPPILVQTDLLLKDCPILIQRVMIYKSSDYIYIYILSWLNFTKLLWSSPISLYTNLNFESNRKPPGNFPRSFGKLLSPSWLFSWYNVILDENLPTLCDVHTFSEKNLNKRTEWSSYNCH